MQNVEIPSCSGGFHMGAQPGRIPESVDERVCGTLPTEMEAAAAPRYRALPWTHQLRVRVCACGTGAPETKARLVFVSNFDLVLAVTVELGCIEVNRGQVIAVKLLIERMQIVLLELVPLLDKVRQRL